MPAPVLDFWFDFASTYSYLAAMRIGTLAQDAGVRVRFRPFLLGPIFKAQGWNTSPFNLYPAKGRNMWRDLERLCEKHRLPWRRPTVFPRNSLLAARVACCAGTAISTLTRAIFGANFADDRDIADPAVLREIIDSSGADGRRLVDLAQTPEVKAQLRANTAEAQRLGIFGAPDFVADGELFFGQDRLEDAIAWAQRSERFKRGFPPPTVP